MHTFGPWVVFHDSLGCDVITGQGDHIASVEPVNVLHPEGVMEANARLIAAAPDMLAVLQIVRDARKSGPTLKHFDELDGLLTQLESMADDVIAKAEGV
jgi:hypothetical protein